MNFNQAEHLFIFLCCLYSGLSLAGVVKLPQKQQQRIDRLPREKRIIWLIVCALVLAEYAYFIFYKDVVK
jgi:hypothetical protein